MFVKEGGMENADAAHSSGFFISGSPKQGAGDMAAVSVIPNLCCTLESPGKVLKYPCALVAPQTNGIKVPWVASQAQIVFKISRCFRCAAEFGDHCATCFFPLLTLTSSLWALR